MSEGSNYLIGTKTTKILNIIDLILSGKGKESKIPELWDGGAGDRIISIIVEKYKDCIFYA